MGLPTGIFSHPQPGRLRVIFNSDWSRVDNPSPPIPGPSYLSLRAYVGSGPTRRSAVLDPVANTATIEVPYAGGYHMVPVGMEIDVNTALNELYTAAPLSIHCHLLQDA